jgi:hypothetical protein
MEPIAQRIGRHARLVRRENVIAGSDCGFGTRVAQPRSIPTWCGRRRPRWPRARASRRGSSGRAGTRRGFRHHTTRQFATATVAHPRGM